MTGARRWALAGFSGSGKSTVARLLAAASGRRLVDLDDVVGAQRVLDLLHCGEGALRAAEAAALAEIARGPADVVVALGGGALEGAESREALLDGYIVAWLDAPLQACLSRCAAQDRRRPVLAKALEEGEEALRALHALRTRAAAHAAVVADASGPPEDVARFLLRALADAESKA